MQRRFNVITIVLLLALAAAMPIAAQPNLNFKRVTVNWPTIELYFTVGCNGQPAYNMTKQNLRIFENGAEVKNITLWCPDPTIRCPVSAALVFDASGSMAGSGNAGAKQGGHAFVDLMDGVVDEATVIWFDSRVTIYQQMTTIKPMLHSAVDGLPAAGTTAVWDGIYAGIIELINNGVNQCRGVVALTDGGDNASTRTVAEIISLANRHGIHVFTVGLGTGVNAVELEQIALLTGGRYYQTPNAGQLGAVYGEIFTLMSTQMAGECIITYDRQCADGALRTVELQLANFCGGSDAKTKTYRAPLDSATFSQLDLEVEDTWALAGTTVNVPLKLVTPMNGEMFYPFECVVRFDTLCMDGVRVSVPSGTLLEGVPVTVTPVSGGLRINTNDRVLINGSGTLLMLQFDTPVVDDTTCCTIDVTQAAFEQGCRIPVVASGNVCFYPPVGEAWACDVVLPVIGVDTARERYDPMPFDVAVTVRNIGPLPIDSLAARIEFQPDLAFAAPDAAGSEVKPITPSALAVGQSGTVSWRLTHPKSPVERSYSIRVIVRSPRDSSECESILRIPAFILPPFRYDLTVEGSLTICDGDSVVLDGGDYAQWLWSTGATTRRITVTRAGDYSCTVVDTNSRIGTSNTVRVVVRTVPRVRLTFMDPVPFCEGDSARIDADAGYASYLWNTGETTQAIYARQPGLYWVVVKTSELCTGYSDTVMVTTLPAPEKPVVTRSSDVLLSTVAPRYQWLRNDAPLPGDTNQYLRLPATGRYRVRVTGANGCEALSDEIAVNVLSTEEPLAASFSMHVYPNPADGRITVQLDGADAGPVVVTVTDMLGRVVAERSMDISDGPKASFDLSALPPGACVVTARGSRSSRTVMVVLR